ncbi:Putative transposase%2C YhgA-like [Bordetella ansorpii]|uniref:Putative transposase, YhgA-like n=1 Tax=Bordetella ansorpii TaxID=288768 RepID=A0A157QSK8_9BORD|nr:Rpn family recombination-promoting nuclease/putative transposase [Bordetella ansorpii]SAI48608.1 Putative transposase%2C YhgA-like [Bordetella ansorpii]
MTRHDASYKLLFSHPEMIQALLQGFVGEPWIAQLDFSSIEKVPVSFVTDDRRARLGDLAWRIKGGDRWLYVYVLLEFQSSVEPRMALRMMAYLALFYQDLARQRAVGPGELLPPVLPLVLYNGESAWHAVQDVAQLIAPLPGESAAYRPALRYCLVDQQRWIRDGHPAAGNLAAAFFQLERSRTPEEIGHALTVWLECAPRSDFSGLHRDLVRWLRHSLLPARMPGARIPELNDIQEARAMLYDTVKGWTQDWLRDGLKQGNREGRQAILGQQLVHRFGPLPADVQQRVARAQAPDLDRWALSMLSASTLDDVFAEPAA